MKTVFLTIFLFLIGTISHAFVQFEVQPLSVRTQQEVMGVQTSYGQKGVIMTGQRAQQVARVAGYQSFNPKQEMIVMSGSEVSNLVTSSTSAGVAMGSLIIITTAAFTKEALQIAFGALYTAGSFALIGITAGITVAKTLVSLVLGGLGDSYYVIDDSSTSYNHGSKVREVGPYAYVCRNLDDLGQDVYDCI